MGERLRGCPPNERAMFIDKDFLEGKSIEAIYHRGSYIREGYGSFDRSVGH